MKSKQSIQELSDKVSMAQSELAVVRAGDLPLSSSDKKKVRRLEEEIMRLQLSRGMIIFNESLQDELV